MQVLTVGPMNCCSSAIVLASEKGRSATVSPSPTLVAFW